MKKRVISSIFMLIILFGFLALRMLEISTFDFMLLGINLIGAYEVSYSNTKAGRHNFLYVPLFFVIFNYLGLTICFAYQLNILYTFLVIVAGFASSVALMFILALVQKEQVKTEYEMAGMESLNFRKYIKQRYVTTIKVMLYPCLLLTIPYYLNNFSRLSLDSLKDKADIGWFLISTMFSISMATDTFAFFTGRLLKGPKLAPTISPNKTISGAIGGLIFGTLAAIAVYLVFNIIGDYNGLFNSINLGIEHVAMIGVLGSILNQAGDLYESMAKRKLGIKDFGNLFPGHGGIIDRVDGLSFVSAGLFVIYLIALS